MIRFVESTSFRAMLAASAAAGMIALGPAMAASPLAGMVLDYIKQRIAGELEARATLALTSSLGMLPGMGGSGNIAREHNLDANEAKNPGSRTITLGMESLLNSTSTGGTAVFDPTKLFAGMAGGPPPSRAEAQATIDAAVKIGAIQPGETAELMSSLTDSAHPAEVRGMLFSMLKQQVGSATSLQKQISSLSPEQRKRVAQDIAAEMRDLPTEDKTQMLAELESGIKIFPRDMVEAIRVALGVSGR